MSRHLKSAHKDRAKVAAILHGSLTKKEERKALALIRNEGIILKNKKNEAKGLPLEMVKECENDVLHCSNCLGTYAASTFHRHKAKCMKGGTGYKSAALALSADSFAAVLNSFQDTDVGRLCRTDPIIINFGKHLWQKDSTKVDKRDEVRKSVMNDMRMLAHLFLQFKICQPDAEDASALFKRSNWTSFSDAVINYTSKDDSGGIKHGLKNSVYYLATRTVDFLIGEALHTGNEREAVELRNFAALLKHHQNALFGDCKYQINKARQEQLRLPSRTPDEKDIQMLRDFTVKHIMLLSSKPKKQFGKQDFVQLRNLVCCRLTIFNARRGGEPARMTVDQWESRDKWVNQSKLTEEEKKYFKEMTVMYSTGKGNHLVSTIVPVDCIDGINILVDESIREASGVLKENKFLFPSLSSLKHCSGWDCTNYACTKSGVGHASSINATNNRGRLSTAYAAMDVPKHERELFYKHMGHSEQVNAGTYQRPLAVQAVSKVGRVLSAIDGATGNEAQGNLNYNFGIVSY